MKIKIPKDPTPFVLRTPNGKMHIIVMPKGAQGSETSRKKYGIVAAPAPRSGGKFLDLSREYDDKQDAIKVLHEGFEIEQSLWGDPDVQALVAVLKSTPDVEVT
jgi:hypothetical protein